MNPTGAQLKRARIRLGLTAMEFAQVLHVHEVTVYRWEAKGEAAVGAEGVTAVLLSNVIPKILDSAAPEKIGDYLRKVLSTHGTTFALCKLWTRAFG